MCGCAYAHLATLRAIQILYELTMTYRERGVGLHFVHLRASQVKLFQLVGISEMVSGWSSLHFEFLYLFVIFFYGLST